MCFFKMSCVCWILWCWLVCVGRGVGVVSDLFFERGFGRWGGGSVEGWES